MRRSLLVFLLALPFCVADNVINAWDAQKRVNNAYFLKLDQCKQTQTFFLLVPNDVEESDVQLCEGDLLAAACPLKGEPASCVLLLFKKAKHRDVDR